MAKKSTDKKSPAQIVQVEETGYSTRVCVPAPMPVQCPHCGSSDTTTANGVHFNLHFGTRYEHRVCKPCGFTFTACRRMTKEELARKSVK